MTRINTNVGSLVAQRTLTRSNDDLQTALTRLSTGLRINVGKDDPAGLIASEALRSDIRGVEKAISNSERANQIIATADSGLSQISSLLNDIRGLVTEAANSGALSDDEIAANQLQVDSSLEAINRIAQTTSFQGRKLLDGSLSFITTGATPTVRELNIDHANLGTSGTGVAVAVTITTAATQAQIDNVIALGVLDDDLVIQVSGSKGSDVFQFELGATTAQISDAINLSSDSLGVEATDNAGTLELRSTGYGEDAFVAVEVISEGALGTFDAGLTATRAEGGDIVASVNGITANGKGNTLSINTVSLALSITVLDGDNTAINFNIDDGGALFQLGPDVISNQQSRIGLQSVNTAKLGGVNGRLFELATGNARELAVDPNGAALIVDEAINDVTKLRGRLGAFQRTTLDSSIAALGDTLVNLTDAESTIRDADFAAESARLTRAQILVQSGTQVLSIANQSPQNVLSLLR